ncbi:hypothetical protein OH77DRAFT_344435 [Trametes cingulata]|nr:hypothetical protein OH77DRAFT_344435 [Trametes cingulata]
MATYMPLNKFLLTFFPRPSTKEQPLGESDPKPYISHKDVAPFATIESERDLATKFAKLVNTAHQDRPAPCPGFKIALSQASTSEASEGEGAIPYIDGALYPVTDVPTDGLPHWGKQRLLVRFTLPTSPTSPFDCPSPSSFLNQVKPHIANALARTHRTALYLLHVHGRTLRLARWDRAGAILTEAVDYTQSPHVLRNALYAFSLLSPAQQGLDPTAVLLGPGDAEWRVMEEWKAAREGDIEGEEEEGRTVSLAGGSKKQPRVWAYVRRMFAASLEDPTWPRYKLLVPTSKSSARAFLVGKPAFVAPAPSPSSSPSVRTSVAGRGTRGYVALDCATRRFVWLKDTWVPDDQDVEREGETLRKLKRVGVRNVPTLVCEGELPGQETMSQLFWDDLMAEGGSNYPFVDGERGSVGGSGMGGMSGGKRPRNPRRDSVASSLTSASSSRASTRSGSQRTPPSTPGGAQTQTGMYRHYRIVVEEVCMPLSSFRTGRQLVAVIRDCVEGASRPSSSLPSSLSSLPCPTFPRRLIVCVVLTPRRLGQPTAAPSRPSTASCTATSGPGTSSSSPRSPSPSTTTAPGSTRLSGGASSRTGSSRSRCRISGSCRRGGGLRVWFVLPL